MLFGSIFEPVDTPQSHKPPNKILATQVEQKQNQFEGRNIDGRYILEYKLGEGGMGVVFAAKQISTNRQVALKILKVDVMQDDGRFERFEQEIDIISNLSHPNIVRVIDTGTLSGHNLLYVVMELIEGISLGDLLWFKQSEGKYFKCRTRVELALEIAYQICGALTEPHRQGIIHRDIKPENILLAPSSDETIQLKVLDFGIARVLTGPKSRQKITNSRVPFVGTPHYMAPEQVARSQYDARTDLYAVGVMLYEMITGQYPFDDDNMLALLLRKTQQDAPNLQDHIPDQIEYPEVVELVASLLSREIDERPADAMKVRRMIEDIRDKYRLRRVRVDAGEFFDSERPTTNQVREMGEDERLDPFRSLYKQWLQYPSGKPIALFAGEVWPAAPKPAESQPAPLAPSFSSAASSFFTPEPAVEDTQNDPGIDAFADTAIASVSDVMLPVSPQTQDGVEPELDEDEDIHSHTSVLAAPKRHQMKAWNVDASEWTDSLEQEDIPKDIDAFEGLFEEEPDEDGEAAVTAIWDPVQSDILRQSFAGGASMPGFFGQDRMADTLEEPSVANPGAPAKRDTFEQGVVPSSFSTSPGLPKSTPDFGATRMDTTEKNVAVSHDRLEVSGMMPDTIPDPISINQDFMRRLEQAGSEPPASSSSSGLARVPLNAPAPSPDPGRAPQRAQVASVDLFDDSAPAAAAEAPSFMEMDIGALELDEGIRQEAAAASTFEPIVRPSEERPILAPEQPKSSGSSTGLLIASAVIVLLIVAVIVISQLL